MKQKTEETVHFGYGEKVEGENCDGCSDNGERPLGVSEGHWEQVQTLLKNAKFGVDKMKE